MHQILGNLMEDTVEEFNKLLQTDTLDELFCKF